MAVIVNKKMNNIWKKRQGGVVMFRKTYGIAKRRAAKRNKLVRCAHNWNDGIMGSDLWLGQDNAMLDLWFRRRQDLKINNRRLIITEVSPAADL
jgi:hypothetical protein